VYPKLCYSVTELHKMNPKMYGEPAATASLIKADTQGHF